MTDDDAILLRERFHAEGNRFGMMARYHRETATFLLGADAARHLSLADKWEFGRYLSYAAAGAITAAAGIDEYGRAWSERLQPDEVGRR